MRIMISLCLLAIAVTARGDSIFNDDGTTYDSHPSATLTSDGSVWIAWHAYENQRDQILCRRVSASEARSTIFKLSEAATVSPPEIVVLEKDVMVFWAERKAARSWTVMGRVFSHDHWGPTFELSADESGLYPSVATDGAGGLVVAWSGFRDGRYRIRWRRFASGQWSDVETASSGEFDAQRPAVAVTGSGQVWIAWDEFNGEHYTVQARKVAPGQSRVEAISRVGDHALKPTLLAGQKGLFAAWLEKVDVVGGPGVISQWHTLQAAQRVEEQWKRVVDQQGNSPAAELTQGLMAQIAPTVVATGGYLGRRTDPMLVEHAGAVWLLWERKSDHRGSTWRVLGDLLGRPMQQGQWGTPVTLHTGLLDYHLIDDAHENAAADRIPLVASRLPRNRRRIYQQLTVDVQQAKEFRQDAWEGWSAIELPRQEELTERQAVSIGGKQYHLYWADLHCHSGLTADAEGEADELMHYARDRARLDIAVFTNNDFIYDVPLTNYEYDLSNDLASIYRRDDFLTLPGYEWTSRIPGVESARVGDPGNWTPPYKFRSFPNHRSVIYPPSGGPVVRYPEVSNDIATLNDAVAAAGGITLTQHEAFETTGHPVEVAMELTSGWRRYVTRRTEQFHGPLNRGHRLGFVACGDTHRRAPGLSGALTGIYAETLTSEDVLEALRARRCFATSGSRIMLDARANGTFMGSETVSDGSVTLTLRALGVKPITRATLVRNGQEIRAFEIGGEREIELTHHDEPGTGSHWYYWRVEQTPAMPDLPGNLNPAFGHLAWSSPHWVTKK